MELVSDNPTGSVKAGVFFIQLYYCQVQQEYLGVMEVV
jgi:hypothetical protein